MSQSALLGSQRRCQACACIQSEPSIRLSTRHHSAVQLIDRAEQLGLVIRHREDSNDRRIVRLTLTKAGEEKLAQLSTTHLEELQRLATFIHAVVDPSTA